MTIEHLLSALIARGLPSRPPTFSIPYTGAQLSSRYSCFFDPPTYSLQCLVLPDSGFPAFWFHQTFRLDWLRVGIPTSSLPKAEGLPKTPHVITLVFWPLHLDFSLPRSLKSTQPPQIHIVFGALISINLYTTTYTSRNSDISLSSPSPSSTNPASNLRRVSQNLQSL